VSLVLSRVSKRFGGLRALDDVSFTVGDRSICGLIGPNGAGKTTLMNLVTGVYPFDTGSITFAGVELGGRKPAQIAALGIARTFQNIRLFGQLSVLENLLVAGESQKSAGLRAAVFRSRKTEAKGDRVAARARRLLELLGLAHTEHQEPTELSYGDQRRVEIARAMMLSPKLLLLDEPAAGMNSLEAGGLQSQIRWLSEAFEVSVVLVEHNMQVVMGVSDEVHVLDHGASIAHGTPAEVRANPEVLAAYLGQAERAQ
jgi:branched-chain amino acid transport system ATP-binding protein